MNSTMLTLEKNVIIKVQDLTKTFAVRSNEKDKIKRKTVLSQLNFKIFKNDCLGVVGESGSGKTTLGRLLIHLLEPDSGQIFIDSKNVTELSNKDFLPFRKKIQMVFQNPLSSLNPSLNVKDHLIESVFLSGTYNKEEVDIGIEELMTHVHLSMDKLDSFPHQLSGGECRRVGLARILALKPEILILDEPVASLDQTIKYTIIDLLMEIKERNNLTFIWISHDLEIVKTVANRIMVLFRGNLMEILKNDRLHNLHYIHPYTQDLLNAAQLLNKVSINSSNKKEDIVSAEDFGTLNSGCLYSPNCTRYKLANDGYICKSQVPKLNEVGTHHQIACHYPSIGLLGKTNYEEM